MTPYIESIEQHGFAIVENIVAEEDRTGLLRDLENVRQAEGDSIRKRRGVVYARRDLLRGVPAVRELAESAPFRKLIEPILGAGALAVRGLLFDKTAEANWVVPWHQDVTIAVKERVDLEGLRKRGAVLVVVVIFFRGEFTRKSKGLI